MLLPVGISDGRGGGREKEATVADEANELVQCDLGKELRLGFGVRLSRWQHLLGLASLLGKQCGSRMNWQGGGRGADCGMSKAGKEFISGIKF